MSQKDCLIDERLAAAKTLPSEWYFDPAILEQEKRKVFGRTWQLVGRADQVASRGQYLTTTIGDEPILIARGADEKLRAFSNVCRHRAGPVASGSGQCKAFQCGYHGWSYALDGRLLGTPEFEGVECFNKSEYGLPEFQIDTWAGLIFVNLNPDCEPLANYLGNIPSLISFAGLSDFGLAARKDWFVDCNWKVYVDNYLEGYHIPVVHPGLNREIDYSQYVAETSRYHSVQYSPLKSVAPAGSQMRRDESRDDNDAKYVWLFPNLMINIYSDNFSTNLILPLGPERTLTVFEWYFRHPEEAEVKQKVQETIVFSDEIQIEDIAICEAVQRGLRSKTYSRGRYSVKRENGVHHFHRLMDEFFSSETVSADCTDGHR